MKLEQIKKIPVYQTAGIAADTRDNIKAHDYIVDCLHRMYSGDYGIMPAEDTAANNAELEAGEGRILARYPAEHGLEGDIYICAYFSESMPGLDYNNCTIMYVNEY